MKSNLHTSDHSGLLEGLKLEKVEQKVEQKLKILFYELVIRF